MSRKKALGQDPLAWIKLTQEQEAQKGEGTGAAPAPVPAPQTVSMNWSFLVIYIVNMVLLLALVFLVHRDLTSRLHSLENELQFLRRRIQAVQETPTLPNPGPRTAAP